jgi:hypothetical protein
MSQEKKNDLTDRVAVAVAAIIQLAADRNNLTPTQLQSKLEDLLRPLSVLELESFVPLPEVARLRSTSIDTLKREDEKNPPDQKKIKQLSARRKGMRLKHALML